MISTQVQLRVERAAYRHLGDAYLNADLEKMVNELIRRDVEHQAAIAAAVQAEHNRETESDRIVLALADVVSDLPLIALGGGDTLTGKHFHDRVVYHAAAIRARSEAKS